MRRPFDWYGLALPAVLAAGGILLGYAALGGGAAWAFAGWILVGVGVLAAPYWILSLARASAALARANRDAAAVRFVGATVVDGRVSRFAGFGAMAAVLADADGVRMLRGSPPTRVWAADWSEVAVLVVGEVRLGRTLVPTIDIETDDGVLTRIRVLHHLGWPASFAYATAVLRELTALRR